MNLFLISFWDRLPPRNVLISAFAATFGSAFLHGFYSSDLNTSHKVLQEWLEQTLINIGYKQWAYNIFIDAVLTFSPAIFFLGGLFGALIAGFALDKHSRRKVISATSLLMLLPSGLTYLYSALKSPFLFLLARLLFGVIAGIFSCVVPVYLVEISPANVRGIIGTFYGAFYALGVATAYAAGQLPFLKIVHNIQYLHLIVLIPMAVQIILQFTIFHNSPRYLMIQATDREGTEKVLTWLYGSKNYQAVEKSMVNLNYELEDHIIYTNNKKLKFIHLLKMRDIRRLLSLSLIIMAAQQATGINLLLLFSTEVVGDAGLTKERNEDGTLIMGILLVVATIFSMFLIEVAGRRMLMLYGYFGALIFEVLQYLTLWSNEKSIECVAAVTMLFICLNIFHYGLGPNAIPWYIIPEMFNQASRAKAMSIAASFNWFLNVLIAVTFWEIYSYLRQHIFAAYIVLHALFLCLLYKLLPETTNKSITELSGYVRKHDQ